MDFDCYAWNMEKGGWYTHPLLGGICREYGGKWFWYPRDTEEVIGPYDTLREAKEAAERNPNA